MPLTVAGVLLLILVAGGAIAVGRAAHGDAESQSLLVAGACAACYVFGHWVGKGSRHSA